MDMISRMTKKRLGDLLLEAGLITEEQIQHGLAEQRNTGELVGEVLVRLEYISEEDVATTLVQQFGVPFIRVGQYYISKEMVDLFPEAMLRQYMFVPVDRIGNVLVIVSGGVLNQDIVNELERATNCKVQLYIGIQSEVKETIEKHFHKDDESSAELSSLGSLLLGEDEEAGGGAEAGAGASPAGGAKEVL